MIYLISVCYVIDIIHGTGLETSSFAYNYHVPSKFAEAVLR